MSIVKLEGKKDYEAVIRGTKKRHPDLTLLACALMVFERFGIDPEDGRRYISKQLVKDIDEEQKRLHTVKKEP